MEKISDREKKQTIIIINLLIRIDSKSLYDLPVGQLSFSSVNNQISSWTSQDYKKKRSLY